MAVPVSQRWPLSLYSQTICPPCPKSSHQCPLLTDSCPLDASTWWSPAHRGCLFYVVRSPCKTAVLFSQCLNQDIINCIVLTFSFVQGVNLQVYKHLSGFAFIVLHLSVTDKIILNYKMVNMRHCLCCQCLSSESTLKLKTFRNQKNK